MRQIIVANSYTTPLLEVTSYNMLMGGYTWNTVKYTEEGIIPIDGHIKRLIVYLGVAPGTDKVWYFTIMKNGVATNQAVGMTGTTNISWDTGAGFDVSAGDKICIRAEPVATPTDALEVRWTCEFESPTPFDNILMGCTYISCDTANPDFYLLVGQYMGGDATENYREVLIPASGTIKNLYVSMSGAPGAGKSYTFLVRKNSTDTTLTGAITGDTDTTVNDLTHSFTVNAGDTLCMRITPSGTPTARCASYGVQFVNDSDPNVSVLCGGTGNGLSTTDTEFNKICGRGSWTTNNTSRLQIQPYGGEIWGVVVKDLYVDLSGAPGDGDEYVFTVYHNDSSTGVTCTIAGASETKDNDTTNTYTLTGYGNRFHLQCNPGGTPTARFATYGVCLYYHKMTGFKTVVGSAPTDWEWDYGLLYTSTDHSMRGGSTSPTVWDYAEISSSTSKFYPSGCPTKWAWVSGNSYG